MATGTVARWERTFGFITDDETGDSIFVHQSHINMVGYRVLEPGQRVSFEVVDDPKGARATNVVVIG
jgi:CspA family cold shock protein